MTTAIFETITIIILLAAACLGLAL